MARHLKKIGTGQLPTVRSLSWEIQCCCYTTDPKFLSSLGRWAMRFNAALNW